jgi:hypothetical protein
MIRLLIALALLASTSAYAQCVCRCVNGTVQPLCRSSLDMPPICAPQICPIVPPSIQPIQPPTIPPIGTTACRKVPVFMPHLGRHEWVTVCR